MATKHHAATTESTQSPLSSKSYFGLDAFEWLSVTLLAVFAASVAIHYSLIDDPNAYRNSPLIVVEFICLILALVSVPVHLARTIYSLANRRFRRALSSAVLAIATIAVSGWAIWYDAPTLIYLT